ncbi:tRNA (adenosine(37)-N6)-threonylcarbamoyltransferase complex ATPase subunit type 1 TsaE [Marinobacter salicampi]|uniref:tRNA (adenosine(37)-N6)-threonylcarbamoyltransferase complex ATPase subunit type 1 TsaE n=1 Tax=Marinobacter salicampi TaxID=435907 RepID=UPI001407AFA4|nr:tRNA (adenosine(37)-N6)-threonylcarbamoyltransferase complex ATPase subunit type 1 TsaE [Marinobacter salicampi]
MTSGQTDTLVYLPDEDATVAFGQALSDAVVASKSGLVLFLQGDLGMGKTTLSRGLVRGLGHSGAVKSPTFTLVEPYEHVVPVTYHFDLYRLGDPEELEYMGIRDYLQPEHLCLIEWPERGRGVLPEADLELRLERKDSGREVRLEARTPRGVNVVRALGATDWLQLHT